MNRGGEVQRLFTEIPDIVGFGTGECGDSLKNFLGREPVFTVVDALKVVAWSFGDVFGIIRSIQVIADGFGVVGDTVFQEDSEAIVFEKFPHRIRTLNFKYDAYLVFHFFIPPKLFDTPQK